jgi:hypothetical protein
MTTTAPLQLDPAERERLARLRAEWELADVRAQLARERFQNAVVLAIRDLGCKGKFEIDFTTGFVTPKED